MVWQSWRSFFYTTPQRLAALTAFLGISSAILSQGGFLAMRCALVHPERVRSLILIATQTGTDDSTTQGYNNA
jgi:pimeloyl-ACP methyl ester carboxylesterase